MKLLYVILLFMWQLSHCPESLALDQIPQKLNQEFALPGNEYIPVVIEMADTVHTVFNSIRSRRFANSDERTTAMVAELQAHTANSQRDVLNHLSRKSSFGKIQSYWITNKISVERATKVSIQELLDHHGFSIQNVRTPIHISPTPIRNIEFKDEDDYEDLEHDKGLGGGGTPFGQGAFKPGGGTGGKPGTGGNLGIATGFKPVISNTGVSPSAELGSGKPTGDAGPGMTPLPGGGPVNPGGESIMKNWGLKNIGADIAHQAGLNGKGIVIAIMDSGVRHTHEALRNNMRPTYNWFDVYNGSYYSKPVDINGHGTHCAGIASGGLGIGVAPGSEWISCRIFFDGDAYDTVIYSCAEWMLCPTLPDGSRPDCSKKPHIVSNSWGGGQGETYFDDVFEAWHLADITPVFAAGNSGPACATIISPGDRPMVIAVGCSNMNNYQSMFSSLGPTAELYARTKPEVCAPGRKINSASYLDDNQYLVFSGTSMACPHMAGAIAVYRQKYPDASFTQILEAFQSTAYQWRMQDTDCNYKSTNMSVKWPNNYCGYGIIRLNAALGITGKPIGGSEWNN